MRSSGTWVMWVGCLSSGESAKSQVSACPSSLGRTPGRLSCHPFRGGLPKAQCPALRTKGAGALPPSSGQVSPQHGVGEHSQVLGAQCARQISPASWQIGSHFGENVNVHFFVRAKIESILFILFSSRRSQEDFYRNDIECQQTPKNVRKK